MSFNFHSFDSTSSWWHKEVAIVFTCFPLFGDDSLLTKFQLYWNLFKFMLVFGCTPFYLADLRLMSLRNTHKVEKRKKIGFFPSISEPMTSTTPPKLTTHDPTLPNHNHGSTISMPPPQKPIILPQPQYPANS